MVKIDYAPSRHFTQITKYHKAGGTNLLVQPRGHCVLKVMLKGKVGVDDNRLRIIYFFSQLRRQFKFRKKERPSKCWSKMRVKEP